MKEKNRAEEIGKVFGIALSKVAEGFISDELKKLQIGFEGEIECLRGELNQLYEKLDNCEIAGNDEFSIKIHQIEESIANLKTLHVRNINGLSETLSRQLMFMEISFKSEIKNNSNGIYSSMGKQVESIHELIDKINDRVYENREIIKSIIDRHEYLSTVLRGFAEKVTYKDLLNFKKNSNENIGEVTISGERLNECINLSSLN